MKDENKVKIEHFEQNKNNLAVVKIFNSSMK